MAKLFLLKRFQIHAPISSAFPDNDRGHNNYRIREQFNETILAFHLFRVKV